MAISNSGNLSLASTYLDQRQDLLESSFRNIGTSLHMFYFGLVLTMRSF